MLESMMTTMRSSSHPIRPMKSRFLSMAGFARASLVIFTFSIILGTICQDVWAATYYVSNSQGNDGNNGLSTSTPWKTLAKISGRTFQANDVIRLKSGDTWTGETFYAHGTGSSTNWIMVTTYAGGNKANISPGNNALCAIQLCDNSSGWYFYNLAVSNAQNGIYSSSTSYQHDIKINTCSVTNCASAAIAIRPQDGPPNLDRVTITGCYLDSCREGIGLHRINNCNISNNRISNMQLAGLCITQCSSGTISDCILFSMGWLQGPNAGTAAVYFAVCSNFVMDNCDISYTRKTNCPDGVAIDFEGNNSNITVQNSILHDNYGAAVLLYRNPDWGSDNANISFINNQIYNNGLENPSQIPAFIRHYNNASCGGTISDNYITLGSGQKNNFIDISGLTNGFQSSFITSSNTVDGSGTSWNAVSGFSTSSNPNGVWTYQTGYGPANMWNLWHKNGLGPSAWSGLISWDENADWPFVGKNNTGSTLNDYWGWCLCPVDKVVMQPKRPVGKWVGVKFTASSAGYYTVKSAFQGLNTGGFTDVNTHVYWSNTGTYPTIHITGTQTWSYSETQYVPQGQSISFLVDGNNTSDYTTGFTGLGVTITKLN